MCLNLVSLQRLKVLAVSGNKVTDVTRHHEQRKMNRVCWLCRRGGWEDERQGCRGGGSLVNQDHRSSDVSQLL